MAPQREAREGVEKRGRLPTRRASRITHHLVAGYQGEVYCVLKAEGNVVLPVISAARCPGRPPAERQTQPGECGRAQEGAGKLKLIT